MKGIVAWMKGSNRWKHLVYGMAVGAGADSWYCAAYAGAGVAGALEFKDKTWGGAWDWVDFGLTAGGAIAGYAVRYSVLKLI